MRSEENERSDLEIPNAARYEKTELSFDSIDALADYAGCPVYCLEDEQVKTDAILFTESSRLGKYIKTVYVIDGMIATFTQADRPYTIAKEDSIIGANAQFYEFNSKVGIKISGIYTESDATYIGTTVSDSCILNYVITNCKEPATIQRIAEALNCRTGNMRE